MTETTDTGPAFENVLEESAAAADASRPKRRGSKSPLDEVLAGPKKKATHLRCTSSFRGDHRNHALCNVRIIDEGALTTTGEDVTCKICLAQLHRGVSMPPEEELAEELAAKKPSTKKPAAKKKSGRAPASNEAQGRWDAAGIGIGVGHPDHPKHAQSLAAKMSPASAPSPNPEHKALAFAELARGIVDRDYLAELLAGDVTGCEPFDLTEEEAAELGQLVHLEQKLSRRARRLADAVIKAVRP